MRQLAFATLVAVAAFAAIGQGCADEAEERPATRVENIPGHEGVGVDSRRMQGPRTMAAETYLRSYMGLFGIATPDELAAVARGEDGKEMFETWTEHLGALGLPDYTADIARASETNALMLGAYERLAMVLCERAAERDLRGGGGKALFDFLPASDPLDRAAFDAGFDSLHRAVLGYPARFVPARVEAFFRFYADVVARHGAMTPPSRLSPGESGWAMVCEALVRHPEFHLY